MRNVNPEVVKWALDWNGLDVDILSGAAPLRDKKYPLHKHLRYKYIDPGHEGALYDKPFDYAEYIKARRRGTTI